MRQCCCVRQVSVMDCGFVSEQPHTWLHHHVCVWRVCTLVRQSEKSACVQAPLVRLWCDPALHQRCSTLFDQRILAPPLCCCGSGPACKFPAAQTQTVCIIQRQNHSLNVCVCVRDCNNAAGMRAFGVGYLLPWQPDTDGALSCQPAACASARGRAASWSVS